MIEQYIIENPGILVWLAIALISFLVNELEEIKDLDMNCRYDDIIRKYYTRKYYSNK